MQTFYWRKTCRKADSVRVRRNRSTNGNSVVHVIEIVVWLVCKRHAIAVVAPVCIGIRCNNCIIYSHHVQRRFWRSILNACFNTYTWFCVKIQLAIVIKRNVVCKEISRPLQALNWSKFKEKAHLAIVFWITNTLYCHKRRRQKIGKVKAVSNDCRFIIAQCKKAVKPVAERM